jgi:hypothetical protein
MFGPLQQDPDRRLAGHAPLSVTGRYRHASLAEVATVVATLTGEAHPLA